MTSIHAAFAAAYQQVQNVRKDSRNDHFGNSYASLENVLDAVKPILAAQNLVLIQESVSDENGVGVHTYVMDEAGERIDFDALTLPLSKADPQGAGSALTYARRYSLKSIFGLAEVDDDGNEASRDTVAEDLEKWLGTLSADEKKLLSAKLGNVRGKPALMKAWEALTDEDRAGIQRGIEEGTLTL